ncbi:MAG: ABC transporter ATP-binding protein [Jatrophihabitans sp.]
MHAVRGLDLEVQRGEIFALLGPNGAGKTTTVEICSGFRSYDSGSVRVLGLDPARATSHWRSCLGVVSQSANDLEDLSVREAVVSIAGCYRHARRVDDVIDAVGLTPKRDVRCVKLSGGQRRRLDVALGMVGDPELLFLDEPTTGFDPEARRHFWELIRQLRTSGVTIVLTTHYLDEAEQLADRVGVIIGGRMAEVGAPGEIGGRRSAQARVVWTDENGEHVEHSDEPTAVVRRLADRFGGEVPGLLVSRPTLEDVYVAMVAEHAALSDDSDARPSDAEGAAR